MSRTNRERVPLRRLSQGAGRLAGRAVTEIVQRPAMLLTPVEPARAAGEAARLTTAVGPLLAAAGRSDGHPVLLVPGVWGGALWCSSLSAFLRAAGHNVHHPATLSTKGRLARVTERLTERSRELAERYQAPVSLVGWSVGGCLVRQVALADPSVVRQVITLGSPVGGRWYSAIPGTGDRSVPVPTTAIYSRTDPYFPPRVCRQPAGERAENVEIPSSHLGMATNALAYHVITDRLALPAQEWRPYHAPRLLPIRSEGR